MLSALTLTKRSKLKTFNFKIKPSFPWVGNEESVNFAQNFAGRNSFRPELLSQHCLITGQTGTGKTTSYVLPFSLATLNYQCKGGKLAGGLVIDPKSELLGKLQAAPSIVNRLIKLGEKRNRLKYFEFTSDSTSTWERMKNLFTLLAGAVNSGQDFDHWREMGITLACDLMEIQAAVWRTSITREHGPVNFLADAIPMLRHFALDKEGKPNCRISSYPVQPELLQEIPVLGGRFDVRGKSNLRMLREYFEVITLNHDVLVEAAKHVGSLLDQFALDLPNPLSCFTSNDDLIRQLMYLQMSVQPELANMSNPAIEQFIDLDPTGMPDVHESLSMRERIDAGGIVVYQPGVVEPEIDQTVGKVLKEMFVRYIQSRSDMGQPIVYVCDEFHRYVSADRHYGEPVFLSFCRSYRVMVCLCTQSISALELALCGQRGVTDHKAAKDCILANIGTKIMMRSTDANSQLTAQSIYPFAISEKRPHVIAARPLSTLKVGESYYMTADARFGREKVVLLCNNEMQISRRPGATSSSKKNTTKAAYTP